MKQVAPLRYGVIFKKAFSQPEIFTAFVKAVLDVDIEIDKVETEKSFKPIIGKVDCRFDLYAEDPKNRLIIDIQHDRTGDHYHRFMYYHLIAVAEQVANAKNYRPNLRVLTIVVLTSYDKHQVDFSSVDFDPISRKGQLLGEIPHKIVYLAPHYVADDTPEPLRQWLLAIKDTLDEQVDETAYSDPIIQQVFDSIESDLVSPTERAKMFEEYNQEELRQEQFSLGVKQATLNIAQNFLRKGLSPAMVAEATGLSREIVDSLAVLE